MIETLRHKAKGETKIWTGISLVSLLLSKKTTTKHLKTGWNDFCQKEQQHVFQTGFPYTFVSFHQEAVPTSCRNKVWVQTSRWSSASVTHEPASQVQKIRHILVQTLHPFFGGWDRVFVMAEWRWEEFGVNHLCFPTDLCLVFDSSTFSVFDLLGMEGSLLLCI